MVIYLLYITEQLVRGCFYSVISRVGVGVHCRTNIFLLSSCLQCPLEILGDVDIAFLVVLRKH